MVSDYDEFANSPRTSMDGRGYGIYALPVEDMFDSPRQSRIWSLGAIANAMSFLPFQLDSVDSINEETDAVVLGDLFAYTFYEDTAQALKNFVVGNSIYGSVVQRGIRRDSEGATVVVSALKYPFALNLMLSGIIGTNTADSFQFPYLSEAQSDLMCSVSLCAEGFHKQALQVLRGGLESCVAHGFFAFGGREAMSKKEVAEFHMPRFGGNSSSMLGYLKDRCIVDEAFARDVQSAYSLLSAAVHNSPTTLSVLSPSKDLGRIWLWADAFRNTGYLILGLILSIVAKHPRG